MNPMEQWRIATENRQWAIRFYGLIMAATVVIIALVTFTQYLSVSVLGLDEAAYTVGVISGFGIVLTSIGLCFLVIFGAVRWIDVEDWPEELQS